LTLLAEEETNTFRELTNVKLRQSDGDVERDHGDWSQILWSCN